MDIDKFYQINLIQKFWDIRIILDYSIVDSTIILLLSGLLFR